MSLLSQEELSKLSVDEVLGVLKEQGLSEKIIKCFEEAEIDGSILPTMTRSDFSDMFKVLRDKRAVVEAWKKVTGKDFDADGNPVVPQANLVAKNTGLQTSTPKNKRKRVIDSDSEDENCGEDGDTSVEDVLPQNSPIRTSPQTNNFATGGSNSASAEGINKDWLRKYQLPNRFSHAVEAGIATKFLPPNLRNEMVRDICTSILNHSTRPNKKEREAVAKMVIEKYPFLRDHPINGDTNAWGSLEEKIMNRFKKLQRKKSVLDTTQDRVSSKGGRPSKKKKMSWTEVPSSEESEEEIKKLMKDIKIEWRKSKKDHSIIKELMSRTYPRRREIVLVEIKPLPEVLEIFPPMTNMLYIKADFGRIMGNDSIATEMKAKFKEMWCDRILSYARKSKNCNKALEELNNAIDSGYNEQECKERACLKLASTMLRPPNKKGQQTRSHEEAVVKVVSSDQSLDQVILESKQPVIVIPDDLYSPNEMKVIGEGVVISEITNNKILDALVILMSTFYVYNIDYTVGKNIFHFIERAVMNIMAQKCPVSVITFINVISNLEI